MAADNTVFRALIECPFVTRKSLGTQFHCVWVSVGPPLGF